MDNEQLLQAISEMMDEKLNKALNQKLQPINDRLDKIDNRLDKNDNRLDGIDNRLDGIDNRLDEIDNRLDGIDNRLDEIDNRLDKIDNRLDMVEIIQKRTTKKLDDLQLDIKIAERDIRRDIHDLNDKMETVIEVLKMNDMLPR